MGIYTRTGRAQRRPVKDSEGRTTGYYLVDINPGNRVFTMKADDLFYEQLQQIVEAWEGTWSFASIVRQLVAEAVGGAVLEELKVPTVSYKARMPPKTVEQEVRMTPKKEPTQQQKVDLSTLPEEIQQRLAKVPPGRRKLVEDGLIQSEKLEEVLAQWEVQK